MAWNDNRNTQAVSSCTHWIVRSIDHDSTKFSLPSYQVCLSDKTLRWSWVDSEQFRRSVNGDAKHMRGGNPKKRILSLAVTKSLTCERYMKFIYLSHHFTAHMKYVWNIFEIYMKLIYLWHHVIAREDMNSTNWPRFQCVASQLSWSNSVLVSRRSRVRISL